MSSEVLNHLEPWSNLNGKIVMVTGASSGLGHEFCLNLAEAGCKIIASARRIDRLNSLCERINQLDRNSCRAIAVELDITADEHDIDAAVQKAWDAFGYIDVLINNAGFRGQIRSSLDLSDDEFNKVVKTNLRGSWMVSKCVCLRLRQANRSGSIINISSLTGVDRTVARGGAVYNSSKAGIDSMTKNMAVELGDYKIKVNSIAPGVYMSEITEGLLKNKWLQNVVKRILPLGTVGTTDPALTSLVRYLIHDSSSYVTGNVFIVDYGTSLPGIPIFSSL